RTTDRSCQVVSGSVGRMANIVLVGGAWMGAWVWQPVARLLRERGHDVYPVTLSGLGDRVHLASPAVDLEMHITDVLNLLTFGELRDIVLVGHSYAAIVVTGVADRAAERLGTLVYCDSGPAADGQCLLDLFSPAGREALQAEVRDHGDGWRLPPPTWDDTMRGASIAGLGEPERVLLR